MPGIQLLKARGLTGRTTSLGQPVPMWPELMVDETARRRGQLLMPTVEQRIVPHLLHRHPAARNGGTAFTHDEISALARHAMTGQLDQIFTSLATLLDSGVTPETLCLDVLAPAARHLGDLWVQDEVHFIDVTIGVARLHQALRRLAPLARTTRRRSGRTLSILLVPVPGEQHHFGLAMAADFFRRAGWNVSSGMSPRLEALRTLVRVQHFDVVGLSAGCDRHVEMLARALRQIRQSSLNTRVVTMVGGPLFAWQPGLGSQLGADAVATDGGRAPALAAAMLPDQGDHHRPEVDHAGPPGCMPVSGELQHSDRRASASGNGDRVRQARSRDNQKDRAGNR